MADLYDVLVNAEQLYLTALSNSSKRVIEPLQTDWVQLNMEYNLYHLAIEGGDSVAAETHLATMEDILNTSDLEVTYSTYILREIRKQEFDSVSTSQTWAAESGTLLSGIDIHWVASTPTVRVGTTLGGDEIMGDRLVTSAADSNNAVRKSFTAATTVYITISGGTVTVNLDYETNYF